MSALSLSFPAPTFAATSQDTAPSSVQTVLQSSKRVTGTVLDETGQPLIGVAVQVEGTTTGTITDNDGHFTVDLPAGKSMLRLSYVGYKVQSVDCAGHSSVSVKMLPVTQDLNEVVVIGYGTMKKRDLTGSIASVKGEDLTLNPGSNPMSALQGKIAGLDITNPSGQAGSSPTIQLRGTRSLQLDDDGNISSSAFKPTYLIDGMPGDISTLNPNDIASIEVLKDAASTAIYGSSGANGVIIVTTKGAKTGKPTVNFDAYVGTSLGAETPKMRTGDSYIQYIKDSYKAVGSLPTDQEIFGEKYDAIQNGQWVDWGDLVLHSGLKQNYSLSVTGGTDKTKIYFSLNYNDERSMYKNDNYKVYSSRIRVDQQINRWINAGINFQGAFTNKNARNGVLEHALFATPLGQPYAEDGTINDYPIAGSSSDPNPLADEQPGVYKNNNKTGKAYVDAYIEWKPFKTLSLRTQLGGNYSNSRSGRLTGVGSYNQLTGRTVPSGSATNSTGYSYKWENIVTYHQLFNKVHDLTLTGVTSYDYSQSENYYIYGENPATNDMLWYALENADNKSLTSSYSMGKGLAFIGRVNYAYAGKYLLSASTRYEGSSRLSKDNRWNLFPAVSVGWRISDEPFMSRTRGWLDNLKLRVGYGVAGTTAGISPYSSMISLSNTKTQLGGMAVPSSRFSQYITNRDLTWEKTHDLNIGIDAAFLDSRINLTADWYNTRTTGVIIARSLPTSIMGTYSGDSAFRMNVNAAKTVNKGIELALSTRNIVTKDFQWNSNVTFTANKEEIKSLVDNQKQILNTLNNSMAFEVGSPVGSYYNYKVQGIWQYSERETAALFNCKPGDIKLDMPSVKHDATGYYYMDDDNNRVDITKDKPYTVRATYDQQIIGHVTPDWTLGFKNDFKYKDFDLSVFLYARWGQMMNYGGVIGKYQPNPGAYNIPTYFTYYDPTKEADQDVLFYAIDKSKSQASYIGYDAMYFVDGSFLKLKNITLGYTLPDRWMRHSGISHLRLYATVTNLFTYSPSKYVKNYDPEMNGSIDFPLSRDFTFGVNLTF
ncbi:MAG: TonB-dependent receptor [Mediterranea sp.]|jgi:TonB-linked SusC/RagA family outer membrane protein|nr:TonB-dependent receptor [Mediterranea sp.]